MALLHVSHPQLQLVGVRTSYTYIFLIFPGHLELWTPLQIPIWGPLLGCTLLQHDQQDNFLEIMAVKPSSCLFFRILTQHILSNYGFHL